jgi:hypothetical protein
MAHKKPKVTVTPGKPTLEEMVAMCEQIKGRNITRKRNAGVKGFAGKWTGRLG